MGGGGEAPVMEWVELIVFAILGFMAIYVVIALLCILLFNSKPKERDGHKLD